jgi:hypothetical protein
MMAIQLYNEMGRQKIIFVSDMHMGSEQPVGRVDNAAATRIEKFRWLLGAATQHNAIIVQAGDLFHSPRDWEALNAVAMALREFAVPFFCVYGQHDMYMRSVKRRPYTALGILAATGLVTVLGHEPVLVEDRAIYGCSYGDDIPAPQPGRPDYSNILILHAPVHTQALFNGHEYTDAAGVLDELTDYQYIHCGDIHRSFFISSGPSPHKPGRSIFNTGPFFRREATEYNFEHIPRFVMLDLIEHTLQWYEIPCKPAEEVLSREHIQEADARKVLSEFIEAIHVHGPLHNVSIVDRVKQALEAPGVPTEVKALMLEVMGEEPNTDIKKT